MATAEGVILVGAAFLGFFTSYQSLPVDTASYLMAASSFAIVLVISMAAMGVYEARVKEGYVGMMLRTAVAIFLPQIADSLRRTEFARGSRLGRWYLGWLLTLRFVVPLAIIAVFLHAVGVF